MKSKKIETILINAGRKREFTQGSVNPVIQRASSLIFPSVLQKEKATAGKTNGELFYGRRGTLTHFSLQQAMVQLEGGAGCALYPCGAAAINNTILSFASAGDHVLITNSAYQSTQDFCRKILGKMNIPVTWFDPLIGESISDLIQSNTSIVILESPGSITMEVQDVPAIVRAVRKINPKIVIILDNTWSAGILFNALALGVDISVQSGTKYLLGHSDAMIGTAVANARCWDQLREQSYIMGQMVDADTAYMAARGLRTLNLRLKQHEKNSLHVARWLTQRQEVMVVNHPALPGCKGHQAFRRDFTGSGGLFSFILKNRLSKNQLVHYLDNFKYFNMAYSWGGFESLILAYQPEELAAIRVPESANFSGTLIRLYTGLENYKDLINDLALGFARIASCE